MYDVVALGEALIDFAGLGTDDRGYPTMVAQPGGAPANFLAAVVKQGGRAAFLGKVGDDMFGRLLRDTLHGAGIDTRGLVMDPDVFTTLAFVALDEKGDRSFSFARKPGADTCLRAEEVDCDLIGRARALHFGTLSLTDEPAADATRRAVSCAREQGKLISFDPNIRLDLWRSPDDARAQMRWGLEQADVVKLSEDEVEFLFGLGPEEGARRILQTMDVKLVFVTCGAEGAYAANRNHAVRVPALQGLHTVDTTGAGDIFGGTALWQLLQTGTAPEALGEEQLRRIARFACTAAGLSTEKRGGIPSVPEEAAVAARMENS